MKEYHKINTIFKRDERGKLLDGQWVSPDIEWLRFNEWIWEEKVDGTNIRIMWDGQKVTFGGKTDNAQMPSFLITRLQERFLSLEAQIYFRETFPEGDTCLYGEGYGAKIQKGGGNYISDGVDFVLFDVWCGGWWLRRGDVRNVGARLNVPCVPVVGEGDLPSMIEKVREGFKSMWGDFTAEGIVARPPVDISDRKGDRIVVKLKTKDFGR